MSKIVTLLSLAAVVFLGESPAMAARAATQPAAPPVKLTHVVHAYGCFSPDDSTIVFQSNACGNWELFTMRADGTAVKQLTTNPAADITPVFSPDGAHIAFVSERDGNREVYVCRSDGADVRRITTDAGHDIHPVWSRDGRRIMFSSNRGNRDEADYDIYEMNADGTDVRRLTSGPQVDTYASRSPDGSRIVTRRVVEDGNNEVFVLDADGTNAVNLTNDPARYDGWPVWSPDGKRIAFASGAPGRGDHTICLMNPDGSNRVQLTYPLPGWGEFIYNTQPAFSRDGRRLVYTMYRPGERESADLMVIELPPDA